MNSKRDSNDSKQLKSDRETLPIQLHADPFVAIEELTGIHQPIFFGPRWRPFGRRLNFESPRFDRREEENRLYGSSDSENPQAKNHRVSTSEKSIPNRVFQLSEFDTALIRRKAWQLVGRYGFSRSDLADIQQELTYRLLKAAKSFDPERAHRNAFSKTIIDRSAATLVRSQRAEKRDYRCHRTFTDLSAPQNSNEALPLENLIESQETTSYNNHEILDWVEKLPEDLQELVHLLQLQSLTEIQQRTHLSRYQLKKKMARLKRSLLQAGFGSI